MFDIGNEGKLDHGHAAKYCVKNHEYNKPTIVGKLRNGAKMIL